MVEWREMDKNTEKTVVEQATFVVDDTEINMSLVDGEIRIYADGTLKVIPWATNSIRLSIDK